MKISIITPVYNIEKYIGECIKSVLSQTYTNWELILINDGSTDNSGNICDEYANTDHRIRVIHKKNEGVVAARNDGAKMANGEFIFFIDGDDFILPETIEKHITKQKLNNADLVRGSFAITDEHKNIIDNRSHITPTNIKSVKEWMEYIIDNNVWSIWNNLIRKDLYIKTISAHNPLSFGEDLLNSIQLSSQIKTVDTIQDITYLYIQRNDSVMNKSSIDKTILFKSTLKMILSIDSYINDNRKELENSNIIIKIEDFIAHTLFRQLLCNKELSRKYRIELYPLFVRYYKNNRRIRIATFKKSPRRYFKYWLILNFR